MDTILPAPPATVLPNLNDGLTPNVGFSDQLPAPPPAPPREPTEAEIDQQIAALPAPLIPIPSLEEMRAKFEELDKVFKRGGRPWPVIHRLFACAVSINQRWKAVNVGFVIAICFDPAYNDAPIF